jgi:hypothetical protein
MAVTASHVTPICPGNFPYQLVLGICGLMLVTNLNP